MNTNVQEHIKIKQILLNLFISMTLFGPMIFESGSNLFSQGLGTVTDFDGNVYTEILIGNQVWLKENLNSLHYSDGTEIPDVVSYNNDSLMAVTYGRLYTWPATMRNSLVEETQGVAPDGYHIPSEAEWIELETFLGGPNIAGGKMKETGTEHWLAPNTGATNSSGFTVLGAGEWDAIGTPNRFLYLKEWAVFWTSTNVDSEKARERILFYNQGSITRAQWYKTMKSSIRCIRNSNTDVEETSNIPIEFKLDQNYPNPFNPVTTINYTVGSRQFVTLKIYDMLGSEVIALINEEKQTGNYEVEFSTKNLKLTSGVYFYRLQAGNSIQSKKMILLK
jgi:uncharacterized protein (TIGR02145 family)